MMSTATSDASVHTIKNDAGKVRKRGTLLQDFVKDRWFVLVVCLWIQSCNGASYAFGMYSEEMKLSLGLSQESLDTIGFWKDVGENVGIVAGLLFDVVQVSLVIAVGATQNTCGYFLLWLTITHKISRPKLWKVCTFMWMATNGQTFFNTAAVVTCVKLFPESRGKAIGLLKGMVGLSSAILSQIFIGIYGSYSDARKSAFLLLMSWLPAFVGFSAMFLVRLDAVDNDSNGTSERYWFLMLMILSSCLAIFLMVIVVIENFLLLNTTTDRCVTIIVIIILLLMMIIPWRSTLTYRRKETEDFSQLSENLLEKETILGKKDMNSEGKQAMSDSSEEREQTGKDITETRLIEEEEIGDLPQHIKMDTEKRASSTFLGSQESKIGAQDLTLCETLRSTNFLLLVMATFCAMGAGFAAINNMGQIGFSQGYSPQHIDTLVSLFSIWGFAGRCLGGFASDILLQTKAIPRPAFIVAALCTLALGLALVALAPPACLYIASTLIGVSHGAQWCLVPAVTSELFGLQHFGTLYNAVTVLNPIASYILSICFVGFFYDQETGRQQHRLPNWQSPLRHDTSSDLKPDCKGQICFRSSFLIMTAVCGLGCVAAVTLTFRTKHFYRMRSRKTV